MSKRHIPHPDELHKADFLERFQSGRNVYYVNAPLVALFIDGFR